ncbi:MAG: hypothetical protein NZO58_10445 [Gemmataceae bacterium]|nr:hypothetical protein [Gemmataceae bacterium]
MAETTPIRPKWRLAGPWLWLWSGLLGCAAAIAWLVLGGGTLEPLRLGIVWLSLLLVGIGVVLRFHAPAAGVSAKWLLIAVGVFVSLAVTTTANLCASWGGYYFVGFRPGLSFLLWLFTAPVGVAAAWRCLRRAWAATCLERLDEACLALLVGAGCAFAAAYALTNPDPESTFNQFTIQRFWFVSGWVLIFGAALTAADSLTQRLTISGLILFHFGGITTAAFGQGYTPWLVGQIWTRIYRPYLEFLYMNNAYHFYAPEPGPPSYLWFYLQYLDANGERAGHWYKVPRLGDDGRHGHKTALEFYRMLSLTENTMPADVIPTEGEYFQKILERRLARSPEGAKKVAIVGKGPSPKELLVPLHPGIAPSQQYLRPQQHIKRVIESYARHVLGEHQRTHPERTYESVKMYRVIHRIPSWHNFLRGWPATDPEFYSPIFLGEYAPDGRLLTPEDDPFLYWQLPILRDRDRSNDRFAPIYDWARRHAGDRYWRRVYHGAAFVWVDDQGNPEP